MGQGRLVKKIYRESKRDHDGDAGVRNWCSHTHKLLDTVDLGEHWEDSTEAQDAAAWPKLVGEKVAAWELVNWRKSVAKNKVLRVYAQMKADLSKESYLDGHEDPTGRMWLARLRSGRHGLAVNTGRFTQPLTPWSERWCGWCVENNAMWVIEDERHVILECPRYASERLRMLAELGLDGDFGASIIELGILIGRGPPAETWDARVKRHKQVKRFAREVLRIRNEDDEILEEA
jgi:hypothetical protein